MPDRLSEAIKQIRIVKEDTDDPEIIQELEQAVESLENAVERLKNDD